MSPTWRFQHPQHLKWKCLFFNRFSSEGYLFCHYFHKKKQKKQNTFFPFIYLALKILSETLPQMALVFDMRRFELCQRAKIKQIYLWKDLNLESNIWQYDGSSFLLLWNIDHRTLGPGWMCSSLWFSNKTGYRYGTNCCKEVLTSAITWVHSTNGVTHLTTPYFKSNCTNVILPNVFSIQLLQISIIGKTVIPIKTHFSCAFYMACNNLGPKL